MGARPHTPLLWGEKILFAAKPALNHEGKLAFTMGKKPRRNGKACPSARIAYSVRQSQARLSYGEEVPAMETRR